MKKPLVACTLFLTMIFTSCSNSDSNTDTQIGGTISFKHNGVEKVFDDIYVSENLYNEGTSEEFTELFVYGNNAENPNEDIQFSMYQDRLEDIVSVFYTIDGVEYGRIENQFTMEVIENSTNKKLRGTFSGEMVPPNSNDIINITEGEFNIQY